MYLISGTKGEKKRTILSLTLAVSQVIYVRYEFNWSFGEEQVFASSDKDLTWFFSFRFPRVAFLLERNLDLLWLKLCRRKLFYMLSSRFSRSKSTPSFTLNTEAGEESNQYGNTYLCLNNAKILFILTYSMWQPHQSLHLITLMWCCCFIKFWYMLGFSEHYSTVSM